MYACTLAHVLYFVLEVRDFGDIQDFFASGMIRSVVDIKPVTAMK